MSFTITRAGILDTIQDLGRYGYQHLGINPTGVMDAFATRLANALAGNGSNEAVIEMHFPASAMIFHQANIAVITGADFSPALNDQRVSLNMPLCIHPDDELTFTSPQRGARCYLAFHGGLKINPWLQSKSTHLKAKLSGHAGRQLKKGDRLAFAHPTHHQLQPRWRELNYTITLPDYDRTHIRFVPGQIWNAIPDVTKQDLLQQAFTISSHSDRMGFLLEGPEYHHISLVEMLSAPVTQGTIQWLPNGKLIILMADHQTTGGYPQLGHIISMDLPVLAQKKPGDRIWLEPIAHEEAERAFIEHELLLEKQFDAIRQNVNALLHEND